MQPQQQHQQTRQTATLKKIFKIYSKAAPWKNKRKRRLGMKRHEEKKRKICIRRWRLIKFPEKKMLLRKNI